jgi:hypothetical protein
MLFSLRSMVAFSWLTAVSLLGIGGGAALPVPNAVPLVAPGSRFGAPDDCAVPALLVPGETLFCANAPGAAAIAAIKTRADILVIGASPSMIQPAPGLLVPQGNAWRSEERMRKLIAFDEDTAAKLKQLARDRMATFQELADEAFADLLKKHGIPIDLKDALKKSARAAGASAKVIPLKKPAKKR